MEDLEGQQRRCLRGLREASARFDEHEGTDEDGMFVALTETVVWVAALDELLETDDAYQVRKAADVEAAGVMAGIRWVRNRGVHQVAAVHHVVEGRSYPMRYPKRFASVMWRPSEEVPKGRSDLGRSEYDELLAGRQVWPTIAAARQFLTDVCEPGPAD